MVTKKTKGKEWFEIISPESFGAKVIGSTMTSDPDSLIGRKINVSLLELLNDFSKYYMKFTFKVVKIEEKKALTEFVGSEVLRDYISRMVLRHIRRVDTIQDIQTKDKVNIRIKCLAIITKKIKSSITAVVRSEIRSMIQREVNNSTLEELIDKIVSDQLKNMVLRRARTLYPIRTFEIRKLEVQSKV